MSGWGVLSLVVHSYSLSRLRLSGAPFLQASHRFRCTYMLRNSVFLVRTVSSTPLAARRSGSAGTRYDGANCSSFGLFVLFSFPFLICYFVTIIIILSVSVH